mmetsp:Transcript_10183/g.26867  ORF Transcript_10183/g.26867 Transcript_10183/m.26867 type:complete len:108 (+) Transcript_10183:53-376(+)
MAVNVSTRITLAQLPQFVGKQVRVVGNVKAIENNVLTLVDDTNAEVRVLCKGVPRFNEGIVEVVGVVQSDLAVDEMTSTQLVGTFSFELYREALGQCQRFPHIYPVA